MVLWLRSSARKCWSSNGVGASNVEAAAADVDTRLLSLGQEGNPQSSNKSGR